MCCKAAAFIYLGSQGCTKVRRELLVQPHLPSQKPYLHISMYLLGQSGIYLVCSFRPGWLICWLPQTESHWFAASKENRRHQFTVRTLGLHDIGKSQMRQTQAQTLGMGRQKKKRVLLGRTISSHMSQARDEEKRTQDQVRGKMWNSTNVVTPDAVHVCVFQCETSCNEFCLYVLSLCACPNPLHRKRKRQPNVKGVSPSLARPEGRRLEKKKKRC